MLLLLVRGVGMGGGGTSVVVPDIPNAGGENPDNFTIRDARFIPEDDDRVMMLVIKQWLEGRK